MVVSHLYKFIYIDVPKTGTSTLVDLFTREYGGECVSNGQVIRHNRVPVQGTEGYQRIISVRNPYDKFISQYNHDCTYENQHGYTHSILAYLEHNQMLATTMSETKDFYQYKNFPMWLYGDLVGWDIVLHLETLEEDLKQLSWYKPSGRLPMLNTNTHIHWKDIFTIRLLEEFNKFAKKDFEIFGYEMKNIS